MAFFKVNNNGSADFRQNQPIFHQSSQVTPPSNRIFQRQPENLYNNKPVLKKLPVVDLDMDGISNNRDSQFEQY